MAGAILIGRVDACPPPLPPGRVGLGGGGVAAGGGEVKHLCYLGLRGGELGFVQFWLYIIYPKQVARSPVNLFLNFARLCLSKGAL
jgi:hypothetical protein